MTLAAREDAFWREVGYDAHQAEFNATIRGGRPFKRDLFGFVDRVYLDKYGNMEMVQVTSRSNMSARRKKIMEGTNGSGQYAIPMAQTLARLLKGGVRFYIVGYDQPAGAGTKYRRAEQLALLDDDGGIEWTGIRETS